MKTQIKQTIAKLSALAFVLSLAVGVVPSQAANPELVLINAEVLASLNLSVDANLVEITVDPDVNSGTNMSGGVITAGDSTTTTVSTNNFAGYKLQISLGGAEVSTGAQLDGSGTTASIAAGDFNTENTFGYALNTATGTTVDAFTNGSADIEYVGTAIKSGLGTSTNSDSETIYYYLNVDHTKAADTYKGTVTYTALTL